MSKTENKTEVAVPKQKATKTTTIDTPKEKMGLAETISLIADRMEAVPKNGHNSFHKYYYTKASDIIAAVNKAKRGIVFVTIPVGFEKTGDAKDGTIVFGIMSFKLIAANGETETAQVPCSGEDKGDKIPYKCMTGALKYLYTTLFNISDVDLDDVENETAPTQTVAKKQAYTNGSNYNQPKVECINSTQQNELLELAAKVPVENQDEAFGKTYTSIQDGKITSAKFENAKVYLQLQAKKKAESTVNQ